MHMQSYRIQRQEQKRQRLHRFKQLEQNGGNFTHRKYDVPNDCINKNTENEGHPPHSPENSGFMSRRAVRQLAIRSAAAAPPCISRLVGPAYHPYARAACFTATISAICTAFVAAPFRRLSETIQRLTAFSSLKSRRILPTKTSSS